MISFEVIRECIRIAKENGRDFSITIKDDDTVEMSFNIPSVWVNTSRATPKEGDHCESK